MKVALLSQGGVIVGVHRAVAFQKLSDNPDRTD
jgi:hypothetical protein